MPVETLRPSESRLDAVCFTSAMPFRILTKGPDYFRRQAEPGARKLSAVERLEADKSKYVKSQQVALTRQAPIKPPIIRKPLIPAGRMLQGQISSPQPRRVLPRSSDIENQARPGERRRPALNLDVLNNLINDVCDGASPCSQSSSSPSPSSSSPSSGAKSIGSSLSAEPDVSARPLNNLKPLHHAATVSSSSSSSCTSAPLSSDRRAPAGELARRPPPVPARPPLVRLAAPYSSPNSVTVRRVDVRPQAEMRKLQRAPHLQLRPRQTAQGQVAHPPVLPLPPPLPPHAQSRLNPPSQTVPSPPANRPPSPMLVRTLPPASPAFTRISNASSRGSSRKHPPLHRSKSDLSDRYSRATADLERFFNYCGLDPEEVVGMGGVEYFTRANSDIVSKLRSVSTPSSEFADEAEQREDRMDDDEDDRATRANERVPYGISVIERNARVIKWLYGIRQARDSNNTVSNV